MRAFFSLSFQIADTHVWGQMSVRLKYNLLCGNGHELAAVFGRGGRGGFLFVCFKHAHARSTRDFDFHHKD